MSSKSPVFPMPEPYHFSDYGFDPQIEYFQVLEEARKQQRESSTSIDTLHFKLQKPVSKEDSKRVNKSKRRWWRTALLFFSRRWTPGGGCRHRNDGFGVHCDRPFRGSISGPVYFTESPTTPYRTTGRPSSGPLAGTLTPVTQGEMEIPYVRLRGLNVEPPHKISTSALPIYIVT